MDYSDDDLFAFHSLDNRVSAGRNGRGCTSRSRKHLATPPAGSKVVGENRFHVVENNGGSLEAIAKNITLSGLLQANPALTLCPARWQRVNHPAADDFAGCARARIVINLAELRLYYYPPGKMR